MQEQTSFNKMSDQTQYPPDGAAISVSQPPVLTPAHSRRLRWLWNTGRPTTVAQLDGIDLDLAVHGFLVTDNRGHSLTVSVTRLGIAHISEVRQSRIAVQSAHHNLASRLGAYLRDKGFFTWENVEFSNPAPYEGRTWGVVRPDVYACMPSLKARNASPAIYEVKVTRADFLADLAKPEKRGAYADLAEAVYYCCQDGLIGLTEVPKGCGLICELPSGHFRIQKKARRQKDFTMSVDTAMTLMVKRQVPLGDQD